MSSIENPYVSVLCMTYNHAEHILECLQGFVNQQSNFKYECIVHDDASPDTTAQIIKECAEVHKDIITPILQTENQYSKKDDSLVRILIENTRGKYIAWCEGDDYWIDPLKLQKQVDFLEAHPEYAMCHTEAQGLIQATGKTILMHGHLSTREEFDEICTLDSLLNLNSICTATVCMRTDCYREYLEDVKPGEQGWLMGDYPMWLWMAIKHKIHYMPDVMAVYRILPESASHSKDKRKNYLFAKSSCDIKRFFNKKYELGYEDASFRRQLLFDHLAPLFKKKEYRLLWDVLRNCCDGEVSFFFNRKLWATFFGRAKNMKKGL